MANNLIVDGREISAGIILTDGSYILGCLPYGRKAGMHQFDAPKGHQEEGEEPIDAAIREMLEETGVTQRPEWLLDLGVFDYTPRKFLHLFASFPDALPAINTLKCSTLFEMNGRKVPEIISYRWIPVDELGWFFPRLEKVLNVALEKIEGMGEDPAEVE
jgi:8-oxo-dGTP pyrophosphatase MutT (NUDIX family)